MRVHVHLAPRPTRRTSSPVWSRSAAAGWCRGRLRARGLDAPAGGADQCYPSRSSSALPVRGTAYERPPGDGANGGERRIRRVGGQVFRRLDRRTGEPVRRALLPLVVPMRSVRCRIAWGRYRLRGNDGGGLVMRLGRSVREGTETDRHQEADADQWAESTHSDHVGQGLVGRCGRTGGERHRSSVRPPPRPRQRSWQAERTAGKSERWEASTRQVGRRTFCSPVAYGVSGDRAAGRRRVLDLLNHG